MKASPNDQLRLLDLQKLDSRADQLRHQRAALPELAEIAALTASRRQVDDQRRDQQVVVDDLTAIVTVADNGGSSGRLRGEFGVLPPGDLRMALAALTRADEWGRTWESVVQHRFEGDGEMRGHVVGNLLIVSLWELLGDHVAALQLMGRLLGTTGDAGRNPSPYNDFILHNSQRRGNTLLVTEEDYIDTSETPPGGCRGQGKFETWDVSGLKNGAITPQGTAARDELEAATDRACLGAMSADAVATAVEITDDLRAVARALRASLKT